MGTTKVQSSGTQSATSTPTPTPEEQELNRLELERRRASQGQLMQSDQAGLSLTNAFLRGQQLPGYFQDLPQGISPEAIGAQATELTRQNLPGFQSQGLMDSGVMQREISRTIANQLLYPAEQFNLGQKLNLLNLAGGMPAQIQAPMQASAGTLAQSLAGLRTTTQTGSGSTSQMSNPFLQSFYSSLGQGLGSRVSNINPFGK